MRNLTTDVYKDGKFMRHLGLCELEMVKRDICFFYEEQTQWATLSGQLSFGYTLNMPYWDYLDLKGEINQDDKDFVRRGSLLLLLSACLEFFDDLGTYYLSDNERLTSLKSSILTFETTDISEKEIKDLILTLTERIATKNNRWEKSWEELLNRLFVTEVYGYFRNKLKTFENHWETLYIKYSNE